MTSRVMPFLAFALAAFAVACGDDSEPTAGRFDESNEDPSTAPPAAKPKSDAGAPKTSSPSGSPSDPDSQPAPGAPGDPTPPTRPSDPTPARACTTARDLGTISGDTEAGQVVAQGNCSDWVKVRVTEDDHYPVADPLKVTATLVSPNPDDFDLYAYVNEAADAVECSTVTAKSELPVSRSDVVKLSWGETYTANASDDSRTVTFEIRKKTQGCSVGQWSLVVDGNY